MSAAEDTIRAMSEAEAPVGAGRLLRGARERANLSVGEVATRLRLDERRVRAIESDDYGRLPAPTFVRGYLHSYSRLLRIPPGPIMEAYDRCGFGPPALVPDIAHTSQARSSDFPVRLVTYAVVALLCVLVVLWWHGRQPPPGPAPEIARARSAPPTKPAASHAKTASAKTTAPAAPALAPPPGGATGVPAPPAAAPLAGPGTVSAPVAAPAPAPAGAQVATTPAPTPTPAAGTAPAAAPAPTSPGVTALGGAGATPATTPQTAPSTASLTVPAVQIPSMATAPAHALNVPAPLPTAGQDHLSIQLVHDAWLEIYDARDSKLFYRLARAGSTVNVSGVGPFRVLLGYARGATVLFDGKRFDFTPYINREVARFVVGGTQAARKAATARSTPTPAPSPRTSPQASTQAPQQSSTEASARPSTEAALPPYAQPSAPAGSAAAGTAVVPAPSPVTTAVRKIVPKPPEH